jgi:molybdate transport system ATP-binding protein
MVTKLMTVKVTARLDSFALNVEFSVDEGLVVLFGPSGCGKSTTLDCIAGLLKPSTGFIEIGGDVFCDSQNGINLSPQRRRVGYVFQQAALFPHLNVRENICFGINRRSAQDQEGKLSTLIELLELQGLTDRKLGQLSGGQIQRVALARALAPDPRVLLLDEPFTALDYELRSQLGSALKSLQRRLNVPMILVTHSHREAVELADTVVALASGAVSNSGPPQQVLHKSIEYRRGVVRREMEEQ